MRRSTTYGIGSPTKLTNIWRMRRLPMHPTLQQIAVVSAGQARCTAPQRPPHQKQREAPARAQRMRAAGVVFR